MSPPVQDKQSAIRKLRGYLRVAAINVAMVLVPFSLLEAVFIYDKLEYRTDRVTCASRLTGYDYCPSITHLRYLDLADKWFPVSNFIDANRRSTYPTSPQFPTNGRRIFLIGDSFIQAEELSIEDRFEHMLREAGFTVQALGYSSWNSRQYLAIIEALDLRADDTVLVFTMGNDYTPSYARASVNTRLNATEDIQTPPDTRSLTQRVIDTSLLHSFWRRARRTFENSADPEAPPVPVLQLAHDEHNWQDCNSIPELAEVASQQALDYITLAKASECWDAKVTASVDLNVELLKEARHSSIERGAEFWLVSIPAGWAFKNQNTLGRMHSLYRFPPELVVSQMGLTRHLESEGFRMIDLELELAVHSQGIDSLYFPADGHFNANAHDIIGRLLVKTLAETRTAAP